MTTLVAIAAWLLALAVRTSDVPFGYAAALLVISIGLELLLLWVPAPDNGRLVLTLSFCELPKAAFLGFYLIANQLGVIATKYLSWSALGLAAAVVAGMAILAARIVYSIRPSLRFALATEPQYDYAERQRHERKVIDATIETIRRNRLYALCAVLVAFLHVTYFTAFAIGIHDRGGGNDLQSNRPKPVKASRDEPIQLKNACDSLRPMEVVSVYFSEGTASTECADRAVRLLRTHKLDQNFCDASPVVRGFLLRRLEREGGCSGRAARDRLASMSNASAFLRLGALFHELAVVDEGGILIELRGHASAPPTRSIDSGRLYYADAELANRRAQSVEMSLRALAREAAVGFVPLEIEWKTYGVSSENSFLGLPPQYVSSDRFRSVEVQFTPLSDRTLRREIRSLASHDQLDLLDYIYFTVYTITTTGYGDIIPLSPFARFVVSIANLYELFFVAIIFNIVAAAGHD